MNLVTKVNGRNFINSTYENAISHKASDLGYEVGLVNSRTSKYRELSIPRMGGTEVIYLARETGITKGYLQIIVRPDIARDIDSKIESYPLISKHHNKRSLSNQRRLFSSNYIAFKNKGQGKLNHEHFGHAYMIDISEGLDGLVAFLTVFKS